MYEGNCLCGAVTLRATMSKPMLRACHCDMCRRQNSAMFVSMNADQDGLEITGPVTVYPSSEWAERGFCATCGSTLFYSTRHDGARYPAAGLFDDLGDAALKVEFYADACPDAYALADKGQRKLTTDETIALFTGGSET